MSTNFKGEAAQVVLQGGKPSAILTGITERRDWDEAAKKRLDTVSSMALDIVSPATRYNKFTVIVPVTGCQLGLTDADIETIVQNGGTFPHIRFDGLIAKMWTKKDSTDVQISATATRAHLCDEAGNVKK